MATTTFSGPIKAGTIKDTIGTTVGSDVANVGSVLMAQSAVIDIAGASNADQVVATIPATPPNINLSAFVTFSLFAKFFLQ